MIRPAVNGILHHYILYAPEIPVGA